MTIEDKSVDTIVIGGGLVGAAMTYGLLRAGQRVIMLDEGDVALRASRGNFGLVWVSSKGEFMPEYARWSRRSADVWAEFAGELEQDSGISPAYHKPGGLSFCLSEDELARKREQIERMSGYNGNLGYGAEMLDRQQMDEIFPGLGPDVLGGAYSPHDGHASPLHLLSALHKAIQIRGGRYVNEATAQTIEKDGTGYAVSTAKGRFRGAQVVLAAGHGNRWLAPMVGLDLPLIPEKGEILVTERARSLMPMPTHLLRQTAEGTIMMGDSHEDTGYSTASRTSVMSDLARHAIRCFPALAQLRIVRSWGAVRILTPDGCPIYQQSQTHPGVFSVNCHSGVTLAGAHALALAPALAQGALGPEFDAFHSRRFANGTVHASAH
ncbi:FAD-dependent oxidoreductase (plasmid) [Thioclava sp. 'Guangxiensis']|uniref:NAD(P)/FAD-dependent oxidoreductase n=1 Tax=Thioclava sp. 'Guangxiensis' TaxID=3149044 RepID=UPI0032C41690